MKGGDPISNMPKGVALVGINRETTMEVLQAQLSELDLRQLLMASDYIRGLKAADIFLRR